ncbi:MAG: DUF4286 family protein [Rickettsiales bacterium]|nr:DUF4286 family protein [Rickettsiales bacterium]
MLIAGKARNVLYQVKISLLQPVTPPYGEWLKLHVQEMLALKGARGDALFVTANIQQASDVFTVSYQITEANFASYEATYADEMRNAFKETYAAQISAFAFERKTIKG